MTDFPQMIVPVDHVEPVPRRIRATLDNRYILDTTRAVYLWEWKGYPQYFVPLADIEPGLLRDTGGTERQDRGLARIHEIGHGQARVYDDGLVAGLVKIDWNAVDHWFEEDDEVFVHPRNPYSRVDPLRSSRRIRIELDGVVLAESDTTVMVFETGLPTHPLQPSLRSRASPGGPSSAMTYRPRWSSS